ncbi:MAG: hypothetical protein ACI9YE_002882 [Psychroserpens sp.]|jgi:hypothetical protein
MKKLIGAFVVFAFVTSTSNLNAGCQFNNWKEVNSGYIMSGGTFIMTCPYVGINTCCIEIEVKEPPRLN